MYPSDIHLVITVALKKELPPEWLTSRHIAVHTLAALKSGTLRGTDRAHSAILFIITGPGLTASRDAAHWIRENLSPRFVLNIGTCGLLNHIVSPARWIIPGSVVSEQGDALNIDERLPIPRTEESIIHVDSLLSVPRARTGSVPDAWRMYNAVDMECHAQAEVFAETEISYHCLKFGTDYSDGNTSHDFVRHLPLFHDHLRQLFRFMHAPSPEISVVIPVHNRQNVISRAIDSVLTQSFRACEIIVVDDCSTDGTSDILKSYGSAVTRIRLHHNSGPSAARNAGMKYAQSMWIAFLDSDDCWRDDKLARQAAWISRHPYYAIMQSEEVWIRNGKRVNPCRRHLKPAGWIFQPSLERCLVSPSAVMVKKSLLMQYGGFDETLPVCEDYDLWLRISRHHPIGLDPTPSVIKYGGHPDQLSRTYPAMDRFRVIALLNVFRQESRPDLRADILRVLRVKLEILMNGYEKRQKVEEAQQYRQLLETVNQ